MFVHGFEGAAASTVGGARLFCGLPGDGSGDGPGGVSGAVPGDLLAGLPGRLPDGLLSQEQVRHLLFGSPGGLRSVIARLHLLGYAEPNDWSRLLATGRANEVMAILTKRV